MTNVTPAPQDTAADTEEQFLPRERRARVYKKGKMVFQNGLRSIPCVVRNLSDGGAMLEFEQPYILPKEFELFIDLEDYEVACERRWEDGLRCGVMFTGEKRQVTQQRFQTLTPSETTLQDDADFLRDQQEDPAASAEAPGAADSGRPQPAPTGGKTGFGKRR